MAMKLKKFIGNQAHWTLNKELVKKIGLAETLILQHLIDLQENIFEGEFYQQQERISQELSLSDWTVKNGIKTLKEAGLIEVIKKGMPSKNYYKVFPKAVIELMAKEDLQPVSENSTHKSEISQLVEIQPSSEEKFNSLVGRYSTDKEKKQEQETNYKKNKSNYQVKHIAVTAEVFDNTFAEFLK
jgi:DNA-binding Lrp family transcriptional regulator